MTFAVRTLIEAPGRMTKTPGEFIRSLERGRLSSIIPTPGNTHRKHSVVAAWTGLTRATSRRVLLTLSELGYLDQEGRSFALTPKVLDLGYSYLSSFVAVLEMPSDGVRLPQSLPVQSG